MLNSGPNEALALTFTPMVTNLLGQCYGQHLRLIECILLRLLQQRAQSSFSCQTIDAVVRSTKHAFQLHTESTSIALGSGGCPIAKKKTWSSYPCLSNDVSGALTSWSSWIVE
ncbi:hypothetical protein BDV26DRAFT_12154 [Aspergillus bertholletiae]|uniref:Uncharacterized protein n=1 Tax=Aspergillus bertholletiae TaxID=1226010 RepID=A0A5N7B383_9EURO|nr:hypothetical protein BDV26DRAFT_12154 [Aspergillus bertholletiae]